MRQLYLFLIGYSNWLIALGAIIGGFPQWAWVPFGIGSAMLAIYGERNRVRRLALHAQAGTDRSGDE